jgi:hypothetical protein
MIIQALIGIVSSLVLGVIGLFPSSMGNLDIAASFDTAPIVAALQPGAQLLPMDALKWVLAAAAGLFASDWVITGWRWFRGFGG